MYIYTTCSKITRYKPKKRQIQGDEDIYFFVSPGKGDKLNKSRVCSPGGPGYPGNTKKPGESGTIRRENPENLEILDFSPGTGPETVKKGNNPLNPGGLY